MVMLTIYVSNCSGVMLLLILYYIARTRILRRGIEDRFFSVMIFGVLAACVCEMLSYVVDGHVFPGCLAVSHLLNTYLFTANLALAFCIMIYVDLGLYHDSSRILKHYRPQIVVLAVMLTANLVNLFVPVTYRITEQNVYERLPFGYAYYAVIMYYFLTGIMQTRKYRKENGTITFFNIHLFLLPVVLGLGLQLAFYGLSLAWLASAMGLAGLFMMQQNEMVYVDVLTGVFNRQYLNYIIASWIRSGKAFDGMMLDIDDYKAINDTYGHSEGDRVLTQISELMKKARGENELVFRFAGDEFIVLKTAGMPGGLDGYRKRLDGLLEAYNREAGHHPVRISSGESHYRSGDVDTFMREMDEAMYLMKAEHHSTPETDRRKRR